MAHEKLTYVELSEEKRAQIRRAQAQVNEELPELAKRLRMANEAAEENTFSGQLRRAIHTSGFHLNYIADRAGTTPIVLDEFLTGERTLRSDVIDRLALLLGCRISRTEHQNGGPMKQRANSHSTAPFPPEVIKKFRLTHENDKYGRKGELVTRPIGVARIVGTTLNNYLGKTVKAQTLLDAIAHTGVSKDEAGFWLIEQSGGAPNPYWGSDVDLRSRNHSKPRHKYVLHQDGSITVNEQFKAVAQEHD